MQSAEESAGCCGSKALDAGGAHDGAASTQSQIRQKLVLAHDQFEWVRGSIRTELFVDKMHPSMYASCPAQHKMHNNTSYYFYHYYFESKVTAH